MWKWWSYRKERATFALKRWRKQPITSPFSQKQQPSTISTDSGLLHNISDCLDWSTLLIPPGLLFLHHAGVRMQDCPVDGRVSSGCHFDLLSTWGRTRRDPHSRSILRKSSLSGTVIQYNTIIDELGNVDVHFTLIRCLTSTVTHVDTSSQIDARPPGICAFFYLVYYAHCLERGLSLIRNYFEWTSQHLRALFTLITTVAANSNFSGIETF